MGISDDGALGRLAEERFPRRQNIEGFRLPDGRILNVLAESKTASMGSEELCAEVLKQMNCSKRTFDNARAELKQAGKIKTVKLRERDGRNKNYIMLSYCGETSCDVRNI